MRRDAPDPGSHLTGSDPGLAVAVVVAVAVVAAAVLLPLGLLEVPVSGAAGRAAFVGAFWLLPGVAGVVCWTRRLGYPAAAAAGVAPGVAFLVVVTAGSALGVGSFGGGDSPLVPFSLFLGSVGFLWATGGYGLGFVVAVVRDRT